MKRTISLSLNKFAEIPDSLRAGSTTLKTISFDTKKLFHHYYIAKFGDSLEPPGSYEYERYLTDSNDWRFAGEGIGRDKEARRNASNELGKGFARWFHSEHLGFAYFCPLEDLIDIQNPDGSTWKRAAEGDLPDYVAGKDEHNVNLLEAKGRHTSTGFKTKAFEEFRNQIKRAKLVDSKGASLAVKGFISVARWATEKTPNVRSQLLVEDPWSEGRRLEPDEHFPEEVGRAMVLGHYAPIFNILQLPLHADAIRARRVISESLRIRRTIWRCNSGALENRRFVGGIPLYDRTFHPLPPWIHYINEIAILLRGRARRFLVPPQLFFGVEEVVFRIVTQALRRRSQERNQVPPPVNVPDELGVLSLLRDGTVIGPEDYFEPVDELEF